VPVTLRNFIRQLLKGFTRWVAVDTHRTVDDNAKTLFERREEGRGAARERKHRAGGKIKRIKLPAEGPPRPLGRF
jgi:hypothetical protein